MATLKLDGQMTVAAFKQQFNSTFGSTLRVYNGGRVADDADTLKNLGLKQQCDFECRSSLTVGSFIERMMSECGLKVKIYTCDGWVAVLDGLTLESSGKVKKNAVKADMESMIAYQRSGESTSTGEYSVVKNADGSYTVSIDGVVQDNAKGAMRQIADAIGFEYDNTWTTQQFGAKLSKVLNGESATTKPAPAAPKVDTAAQEAAAKAKADAAAAKAAAEKAQAEAKVAEEKAAQEKAAAQAAQAAALAAAKAASDKAKEELEKQKAEAEAAKAELARIQAEAAKAKAEAEAAKAAAEKAAQAKAEAEAAKSCSASSASNAKGVLPGLFSVAANKKVRFSKGNLQFNAAKYEFRFAENQWDYIGEGNKKKSGTYDGWIDLFGYGTSGYMGCQPYESSMDVKQYPAQDICGTNYDWGKFNPITNGGNKEGLWRTLTKDEWEYLINGRANADKLRAQACVDGVNGLVILPDDFYEKRQTVPFDSTPNGYSGNNYTKEIWKRMEDAGAVFLPAAGYGRSSYLYLAGSFGYYWSSTFGDDDSAFHLSFYSDHVYTVSYDSRYYCRSVRPVTES